MSLQRQPLLTAAIGLCVAYFALWACAPAVTVHPDAPMPAGKWVAVGLTANGALPVKTTVGGRGDYRATCEAWTDDAPCASGTLSGHFKLSERWSAGVAAFAGTNTFLGAGGYVRYLLSSTEVTRVSIDVSGGWLFGALTALVTWRMSDGLWLYTAPSLGYRMHNAARLPVGLVVDLGGPRLNAEVGAGYYDGDGVIIPGDDTSATAYASLGLEWLF